MIIYLRISNDNLLKNTLRSQNLVDTCLKMVFDLPEDLLGDPWNLYFSENLVLGDHRKNTPGAVGAIASEKKHSGFFYHVASGDRYGPTWSARSVHTTFSCAYPSTPCISCPDWGASPRQPSMVLRRARVLPPAPAALMTRLWRPPPPAWPPPRRGPGLGPTSAPSPARASLEQCF